MSLFVEKETLDVQGTEPASYEAKTCQIDVNRHNPGNHRNSLMKNFIGAIAIAAALQLASLSAISAEAAKTYQVTGPVLEVSDKAIVVQKGDERWEVARNDRTKVEGELKVGKQVTIHYRMVAVNVDAKAADAKKKSK